MVNLLLDLRKVWGFDENQKSGIRDDQISSFEYKYDVLLPTDLKLYFKSLNGTDNEYDKYFYCFNSFAQFKNIDEELSDWSGVPNYQNLRNTFVRYDTCFVFCDYQFHVFSYAIQLYKEWTPKNEVYVLCGDQYRLIADSFTDFLKLYLAQSDSLHF